MPTFCVNVLYTRRDELAEGELPVPLKLVHINRCPVVAPLNVLRVEDRERLQLDMNVFQSRALRLTDAQELWLDKLAVIYGEEDFAPSVDPNSSFTMVLSGIVIDGYVSKFARLNLRN